MAYVYLLSTYGEYGAENVVGTLDRDHLVMLLRAHWSVGYTEFESEALSQHEWLTVAEAGLTDLLTRDDADLARRGDGHNLQRGWGGLQLHVVELR